MVTSLGQKLITLMNTNIVGYMDIHQCHTYWPMAHPYYCYKWYVIYEPNQELSGVIFTMMSPDCLHLYRNRSGVKTSRSRLVELQSTLYFPVSNLSFSHSSFCGQNWHFYWGNPVSAIGNHGKFAAQPHSTGCADLRSRCQPETQRETSGAHVGNSTTVQIHWIALTLNKWRIAPQNQPYNCWFKLFI